MKLIDFDTKVCDSLRVKILNDQGNPHLKEKVLDLINKIENSTSHNVGESQMGSYKKGGPSMITSKDVSYNGSMMKQKTKEYQ